MSYIFKRIRDFGQSNYSELYLNLFGSFIKTLFVFFLFFLLQFPLSAEPIAGNSKIKNYKKATKLLPKIFKNREISFYCGCNYKGKKPDHKSCGYIPKSKNKKKANQMEWEHIVPAHAFGQSFKSWREGDPKCTRGGKPYKGRDCAGKVNETFKLMEADLFNLVPVIGEINRSRSNYSFTIIQGEPREFGSCDFEIKNRKVEPTERIRGNIARTYFYMDSSYPGRGIISKKNRKLFKAWDKLDPVDEWECERAKRIEKLQGNKNRFIVDKCKKGLQ